MPGFPRSLRTSGQPYLPNGGGLRRGQCTGWPAGRQQQRRLGQARPAAFGPVLAERARSDGAQFADEGSRIGGPVRGVLGHPGGPCPSDGGLPRMSW
jgi:hypothetical protein